MKRALVTGATGFVGANLCRRLLRDGHEVYCLVRPEYRAWRIADVQDQLRIHIVDLLDSASLEPVVSAIKPDWVFHLVAHGAYSWQTDIRRILETNLLGTAALIQACLKSGFGAFIHAGSSSEYGFKDHAPAPTEWIDPNSYYAVGKAAATHFARVSARQHNAPIISARLYSVYGPFEEPGRLIPALITHGLVGSLPDLVDPAVARDFIHVRDVEDAFLHLAAHPAGAAGDVFNVGTGIQTTIGELVQITLSVFDLDVEPKWTTMPRREWDTSIWLADNATLLARGWRPRYSIEDGFRETVRWFREHPELTLRYTSS